MKTTNATTIGLTLFALAMSFGCNKSTEAAKGVTSITADEHGYTPSAVEVPANAPTTLTFTRTTDDTCAKEVVFPELKINEPLPLNKAVSVTIPAGPSRTLTFQCGMGMFKGKVVAQ